MTGRGRPFWDLDRVDQWKGIHGSIPPSDTDEAESGTGDESGTAGTTDGGMTDGNESDSVIVENFAAPAPVGRPLPPAAGTESRGLRNFPAHAARAALGWQPPNGEENMGHKRHAAAPPDFGGGPARGGPGGGGGGGDDAGGGGGAFGKKAKKMNGYLLFALHRKKEMERESGQKMDKSMDQVLRMFDEEWKNMSEGAKSEWRQRAKGPTS